MQIRPTYIKTSEEKPHVCEELKSISHSKMNAFTPSFEGRLGRYFNGVFLTLISQLFRLEGLRYFNSKERGGDISEVFVRSR